MCGNWIFYNHDLCPYLQFAFTKHPKSSMLFDVSKYILNALECFFYANFIGKLTAAQD